MMAMRAEQFIDEALSLPTEARVQLIEQLLVSLNLPIQPQIDELWRDEVERRSSQIAAGEVPLTPSEQVFAQIRARYQR
jgi:putative addiction module component (TIGR02574 family)